MFDTILKSITTSEKSIYIIYGFNGIGKTRLSREYIKFTRNEEGKRSGLYYNSYSEDIFIWDNDIENEGANPRLRIEKSSLNHEHSLISEDDISEKLYKYNLKFEFKFFSYDNPEEGIEFVEFYDHDGNNIKISRGEEHVFIWCFYQCVFEKSLDSSSYIFIDDPVSSLDENNIFKIACDLYDLIDDNYNHKKIIITTHHIGLYNILANWLTKGEKANKFKEKIKVGILKTNNDIFIIGNIRREIFLYHLALLDELNRYVESELTKYHFVLLRQLIENISSFLGCGRASYVLEKIGIDAAKIMNVINILSHKNIFNYESASLSQEEKDIFIDVLEKIKLTFPFIV